MSAPPVLCVLGADFSGGSLVNLMLDSHPRVFGAGDVYKLFDSVKSARCSVCIRDCPVWDDRPFRDALTPENVYERVTERTGVDVIVDSSKTLRHFDDVFARDDLQLVPIVLAKHPARLMGSFLANKYVPAEIGIDAYAEHGLQAKPMDDVIEAIDAYFERIAKLYRGVERFVAGGGVHLRYEDLVATPEEAYAPILEAAGLEWSPDMLEFSDLEHHPIGGNAAAHYHLRRQPNPELQNKRETKMIADKRAFYNDKGSALKLDDKYLTIVPEPWREQAFARSSFADACEALGYELAVA